MRFRITLNERLSSYIIMMSARLGIQKSEFVALVLEYFWSHHPTGMETSLLLDDARRTYAVVRQMDNGPPVLLETGSYTSGPMSVLEELRTTYPDLVFGRSNVFSGRAQRAGSYVSGFARADNRHQG